MAPDSLARLIKINYFPLSLAFKSLNEINMLEIHEMILDYSGYDIMLFMENRIHPLYLKLAEACYGHFIYPMSAYGNTKRGKVAENLHLFNRVERLKGTEYEYLCSVYSNVVRNAIAHGAVEYKSDVIIYTDHTNQVKMLPSEMVKLTDDMLDICNGLALAYSVYFMIAAEFCAEHRISLPLPLMLEELSATTKSPGWEIQGCLESMNIRGDRQLNIYSKNSFMSTLKVQYQVFRTAILAEKLSPGYRRYFLMLKSYYSLRGWAAFDGSIIENLRKTGTDRIEDYLKALEETGIMFKPKYGIPHLLTKIATLAAAFRIIIPVKLRELRESKQHFFMHPRIVSIHRNGYHSIINGKMVIESFSQATHEELVRKNCKNILKSTIREARRRAKIFDVAKFLPVGYVSIGVFSKDFRLRKLNSSGLIPELICTISLRRLSRIRVPDILGGEPEILRDIRIVWNRKPISESEP